MIERVQLSWAIRDRQAVLDALDRDPRANRQAQPPADDEDEAEKDQPKSALDELYLLADRDPSSVEDPAQFTIDSIPIQVGQVLVTSDHVILEAYEDERLDGLRKRIVDTLGQAIPPAHPKTRVVGVEPAHVKATRWDWILPPELPAIHVARLRRDQL